MHIKYRALHKVSIRIFPIKEYICIPIEEEYRGRVFGIIEMMAMSAMPIGTLTFGILYDSIPAQYILLFSGTVLICIVMLLLRPSIIEMAHPELKKVIVKPVLNK